MPYPNTYDAINTEIVKLLDQGRATDDPAITRLSARLDRLNDVQAAYKVISQALNAGEQDMVLDALASEHPTLVGKLANVVMAAVNLRGGDGRLDTFNMTIGDVLDRTGWNRDTKLSEIRQPLI